LELCLLRPLTIRQQRRSWRAASGESSWYYIGRSRQQEESQSTSEYDVRLHFHEVSAGMIVAPDASIVRIETE